MGEHTRHKSLIQCLPKSAEELGDDSGFCNAIVFYISSQDDSYRPIIREPLDKFLIA